MVAVDYDGHHASVSPGADSHSTVRSDYRMGVPDEMNDKALLIALAPVVEENLHLHGDAAEGWQPQDLVPWDDGRNFAFLGGEDWAPEQSTLSEIGKLALTVGVLAADNMPSYHRELAKHLRIGPWWRWVGRWTAEENRHSIVIRDYLVLTRAVDPVALERIRMTHMTNNYNAPAMHLIEVLVNAAFEETASSIRHRNTAKLAGDPVVAGICEKIATDDELQRDFYANIVVAALDLVPDQAMRAIADRVRGFKVPTIPLADGRDSTTDLAEAGIYDPARQDELVFRPLLEKWNVFERTDLGVDGEKAREELARLRV